MRYKKITIGLLASLALAASATAWVSLPSPQKAAQAEAPPKLCVVIDQGGNAVIAPVFTGREKGVSKYRWDRPSITDGVTSARLLWVGNDGWPEVSLYQIPLAVEWAGGTPSPAPGPTPTPVPTPTPTPDPVPVPPIPPTPVAQKIQVVVVEETEQSDSQFAKVRNSAEIQTWKNNGGHEIYFLDKGSILAGGDDWKPWKDRIQGKQLPYAWISPKSGGQVLKECECPRGFPEFFNLIRTYGGK